MSDSLFNFDDLVKRVCPDFIDADRWKVVRHKDNRGEMPDLLALLHLDRKALEFYQADQLKNVFNCAGIFSFLGLPGHRALFIGSYFVRGSKQVPFPELSTVPDSLKNHFKDVEAKQKKVLRYCYELQRDPRFKQLEMRAVIEWGKSERSWHQWSLDKPVVEVRDPNALEPCPEYSEIEIPLAKLAFLFKHEDANLSWKHRLSSVGGIYLLTDHTNNLLYVGQAGGSSGFWGRWSKYADQKTGNIAVDPAFVTGKLRMDTTTLSILQVVPLQKSLKPLLDKLESHWKRKLCSREAGYNR